MKTLLITGSDTGIGKTWVTRALVNEALRKPEIRFIQVIKPVETGIREGRAEDAAFSADVSSTGLSNPRLSAHTLFTFKAAMAPLDAAKAEGRPFSMGSLICSLDGLPPADLRLIEGAGGIAVPLDADGRDWSDFALYIRADAVILVVEDRLGAINQARLAVSYAARKELPYRVVLNRIRHVDASVADSNRRELAHERYRLMAELMTDQPELSHISRRWKVL